MENNRQQPAQRPLPRSATELDERLREIQNRAGRGASGAAPLEAEKASMDALCGEN